jgi:RHS repeat-associated protein
MTLHATYRPVRPQRPSHARKWATMRLRAGEKSCNQRLIFAAEKPQPRLHCSQQFSTVALTTSSATIAERYAYSAYGAPTVCNASGTDIGSSTKDNRITYTGREWDDELVLYHFRARLYDAGVGRFLGRDPIWEFDRSYTSYLFVNSSPLCFIDPTGLYTAAPPARHITTRPSSTPIPIPGAPIESPQLPLGPSFPDPPDWISARDPSRRILIWPGLPPGYPKDSPGLAPTPGSPGYPEYVERCWKEYQTVQRETRRKRCCDLYMAIFPRTNDIGGVLCCHGERIYCLWKSGGISKPSNDKAREIVDNCTKYHEAIHMDQLGSCPPPIGRGSGLERDQAPHRINILRECEAYRAELQCLLRYGIGACAGDSECVRQVDSEIKAVEGRISFYCRGRL